MNEREIETERAKKGLRLRSARFDGLPEAHEAAMLRSKTPERRQRGPMLMMMMMMAIRLSSLASSSWRADQRSARDLGEAAARCADPPFAHKMKKIIDDLLLVAVAGPPCRPLVCSCVRRETCCPVGL